MNIRQSLIQSACETNVETLFESNEGDMFLLHEDDM